MALPLPAMSRLAWRNLWRNRRRTVIMLIAISMGVWAMIFMTSILRGMVDGMVEDGLRALPGHVQVHNRQYRDDPSIENSLAEPQGEFLTALGDPLVTGWSARVRVPAMISSERDNRGVILLGVDPGQEEAIGFDPETIIEGRFLEGPDDSGLVLGRKLVDRLETRLGKRVVVMSQDPENNVADRGFRVVGIYRANLEAQEMGFIYAGKNTVQEMLGIEGLVSEIAILGQDSRNVDSLVAALEASVPGNVKVLSWQNLDEYLSLMVGVMDGFVLVFMIVIFLALSFGLINTLMMAVFERIREIGLMQALGMRPSAILYQVLLESMILLALGLLIGNVVALATLLPLAGGIDLSVVSEGLEMAGMSSTLFPALNLSDFMLASGVVILLGLITSLLPAWRASQYRPVEAIAKT
jgi:ABC-type lipoprotein release transport system permease subunit